MDFGQKIYGKRIFGDHKTIRGLIAGTISGTIFFGLQKYVFSDFTKWLEVYDYAYLPVYTGFLMAFGALMGDAIKSFFKRRARVESGITWFPWDQIDWILGMVAGLRLVIDIKFFQAAALIVLGLGLHLLGKVIGYLIKVNKNLI